LQRNLKRTTDTFLFISHTTNVILFKFRSNIFIGVRIIKEMPGSVVSGTHCTTPVMTDETKVSRTGRIILTGQIYVIPLEEKPGTRPIYPLQIPHRLSWDWARYMAVRFRRLTAGTDARTVNKNEWIFVCAEWKEWPWLISQHCLRSGVKNKSENVNTYNQIWNCFSLLLCWVVIVLPNCFCCNMKIIQNFQSTSELLSPILQKRRYVLHLHFPSYSC